MTCKDCIHYKVCYPRIALHMGEDIMGKPDKKMQDCKHFIQIERGRKMRLFSETKVKSKC